MIEEGTDGLIYLYRYDDDGNFAGDTWHQDVEEAKGQATFEYVDALGDWQPVPSSVSNIEQFVIAMQTDDGAKGR